MSSNEEPGRPDDDPVYDLITLWIPSARQKLESGMELNMAAIRVKDNARLLAGTASDEHLTLDLSYMRLRNAGQDAAVIIGKHPRYPNQWLALYTPNRGVHPNGPPPEDIEDDLYMLGAYPQYIDAVAAIEREARRVIPPKDPTFGSHVIRNYTLSQLITGQRLKQASDTMLNTLNGIMDLSLIGLPYLDSGTADMLLNAHIILNFALNNLDQVLWRQDAPPKRQTRPPLVTLRALWSAILAPAAKDSDEDAARRATDLKMIERVYEGILTLHCEISDLPLTTPLSISNEMLTAQIGVPAEQTAYYLEMLTTWNLIIKNDDQNSYAFPPITTILASMSRIAELYGQWMPIVRLGRDPKTQWLKSYIVAPIVYEKHRNQAPRRPMYRHGPHNLNLTMNEARLSLWLTLSGIPHSFAQARTPEAYNPHDIGMFSIHRTPALLAEERIAWFVLKNEQGRHPSLSDIALAEEVPVYLLAWPDNANPLIDDWQVVRYDKFNNQPRQTKMRWAACHPDGHPWLHPTAALHAQCPWPGTHHAQNDDVSLRMLTMTSTAQLNLDRARTMHTGLLRFDDGSEIAVLCD